MEQGSVVVGVDGSVGSDAALEWAVRYAGSRRRPLLIVNGAGSPRTITEFVDPAQEAKVLLRAAGRVTDRALATATGLTPDLEVGVVSPLEDPRTALVDLSARASMVVVGTRGRGPVRALLMGSVSTAVAAHASCPVAVVRPARRDATQGQGHVVVGTDGGPSSTAALELAFDLASTDGLTLDVVHSWSDHDMFVERNTFEQRLEQIDEHERILSESLAGYAEKYPDVSVVRHLPDGEAVPSLVGLSEDAAVVVVGSRGRTGWKTVLDSVSRDVVERAHSTVVVARP